MKYLQSNPRVDLAIQGYGHVGQIAARFSL